uniref:Amine oxidase domain-containing protein n=1 Tax=Tetradesmus obliquus TaxID=3088 RepID=A0A383VMW8_TETOB|eukprot:jgi/Sobl393_1/5744/SZX66092.1
MRVSTTSAPALPGCGSHRSSSRAAPVSHTQQRACRKALQAPRAAAAAGDGPQSAGGSSASSSGNGAGPAPAPQSNSSQQQQQQQQQQQRQQQPNSWRQTSTNTTPSSSSSGKRAVVVGGGWAGFGAALALAKAGAQVTLLDASATPGGLSSAFQTPGGQLVEPGIKGFWYQYANIEALVAELGIPSPFTPFTRSSFWSPDGLQVESPIFQDLPRLPTPLGSFVHTAPLFRQLPLADRATAAPLVKALLEHDLDDTLYNSYDSQSAYELFRGAGVSKKLYEKFLAPMLLVTLFAPPTELSAAAALGALYFFVLAHQPDFDVRWCKGPIGELIFSPLVSRLKSLGVTILGGRRAQQLLPMQDHKTLASANPSSSSSSSKGQLPGVVVAKGPDGVLEQHHADVIVLAAGVPALQQLLRSSPVLAAADDLRGVMNVNCSDVLAVRLWLQQKLSLRSASNVVAGFDDGVGGTFFQLDKLQRCATPRSASNVVACFDDGVGGTFFQLDKLQDMHKGKRGSVLEFDMYHAEPPLLLLLLLLLPQDMYKGAAGSVVEFDMYHAEPPLLLLPLLLLLLLLPPPQDMYKGTAGSVLEFDMYHAEPLLPLSDEAIIQRMLQTYLAPALPGGIAEASRLTVTDASVLRFRNAVTRFSPGSNSQLPGISTSLPNLFVAGDCVKQGPGTHGCKGLSQEKAYVSGLQAGNRAAAQLGLAPGARVLPVEPDEPHVAAAKQLLKVQRQLGQLAGSVASSSSSSSSSSRRRGTSMRPADTSSSSGSSSGGWIREAGDSERRAQASHELRDLMRAEVAEQVGEQKRVEQQA